MPIVNKKLLLAATGCVLVGGYVVYKYYNYSKRRDNGTPLQSINKNPHLASTSTASQQQYGPEGDAGENDQYAMPLTLFEEACQLKETGNKLFKEKKFEEALAFYTQAIETCPEEDKSQKDALAAIYSNRAATYEKLKRFPLMISDCDKSLEYDPTYLKACYRRAKGHMQLSNHQQAVTDSFTGYMLSEGKSKECLDMFDTCVKAVSRTKAQDILQNREYMPPSKDIVIQSFGSFTNDPVMTNLEEYTKDPIRPFQQACCDLKSGSYNKIKQLCDKELSDEDTPYQIESLLLRGIFKQMAGMAPASEVDFTAVIDSSLADKRFRSTALIRRSAAKLERGGVEEAMSDLEQAISLDPQNSDIYRKRTQYYMLVNQFDASLADIDMAVRLSNNDPRCEIEKCYMEYTVGQSMRNPVKIQKAERRFSTLIDEYPDEVEARLLYAQVMLQEQNFEKANELYTAAIEKFKSDVTLLVAYARLMLTWKNDSVEALRLLEKARQLESENELVYQTMGQLYMTRDNTEKALENFEYTIPYTKTEMELCQLFALIETIKAQQYVEKTFGINCGAILQNLMAS